MFNLFWNPRLKRRYDDDNDGGDAENNKQDKFQNKVVSA